MTNAERRLKESELQIREDVIAMRERELDALKESLLSTKAEALAATA